MWPLTALYLSINKLLLVFKLKYVYFSAYCLPIKQKKKLYTINVCAIVTKNLYDNRHQFSNQV